MVRDAVAADDAAAAEVAEAKKGLEAAQRSSYGVDEYVADQKLQLVTAKYETTSAKLALARVSCGALDTASLSPRNR